MRSSGVRRGQVSIGAMMINRVLDTALWIFACIVAISFVVKTEMDIDKYEKVADQIDEDLMRAPLVIENKQEPEEVLQQQVVNQRVGLLNRIRKSR